MAGTSQERCTTGAAKRPLSDLQKRTLVLLARQAFEKQYDNEEISEATEFDARRHQQVKMTVERDGLTACRNEDYLPLKAHWLRVLGREKAAEAVQQKGAREPRAWALNALERELSQVSDVIERPLEYVKSIAQAKYKTTLIQTDLTDKQIWTLVFDLRRSAQARRLKARKTA